MTDPKGPSDGFQFDLLVLKYILKHIYQKGASTFNLTFWY